MPSLPRYLFNSLRRGTLAASAARYLRDRGAPLPMSWPAYAFDRYRRARDASLPAGDLRSVSVPCRPGLVSIVLPAYNGEPYVREALDAVLAQSYERWELIAVDDGSTDGTGAILDEYAAREPRMRVLHQPNRKLPGALNAGFALAEGEFLTWTSCDNRLYPDFLAQLVGCLQRQPDWDMVYANVDLIGPDSALLAGSDEFRTYQRPFGSAHIHLPADTAELNTVPNNFINSAFLYRARVRDLIGEHSTLRFGVEDYDYWMRVNELMRLRHADFHQPLAAYRFHPHSLTGRKEELGIADRRQALLIYDDFRRGFLLQPMLWIIEAGQGGEELANELRQHAEAYARVVHLPEAASWTLPPAGLPVLYVRSADEIAQAPELPPSALRVWAQSGMECPPPPGWDLTARLRTAGEAPGSGISAASSAQLFTAMDTWGRSRTLSALEPRLLEPPVVPQLRASVIVCSHRPLATLAPCLHALAQQDFPAQDYEVIMVNNRPGEAAISQAAEQVKPEFFRRGVPLRLVDAPLRGLSHARNAGLLAARGEIACFIDDDALARPGWLAALWQAFEAHGRLGVAGGRILLAEPHPRPRWWRPAWRRFWSHFDPPYAALQFVERWADFPWGASWAARRAALLAVGGFRAGYGRRGQVMAGGEEIVAARLIQQMGWKIAVQPLAVVDHAVEPARFTLRNVWRASRGSRRSWYQSQNDLYFPRETSPRHAARRLGGSLRALRADSALKLLVALSGELTLLGWQARDLLARMRKPTTRR